jgi:glucose repression mediator protein
MEKTLASLANANENTWMLIGMSIASREEPERKANQAGAVAEQVQDQPKALRAFETALKHNPNSVLALNAVASIHRNRDDFDKAIEYFQRILNIKQDNGEVWGSMGELIRPEATAEANNIGHCLLMKDDLPKAYTAYQQALYHLPNPKVSLAEWQERPWLMYL